MQHRIDQMVELDETRGKAFEHNYKNQAKKNFDKFSRARPFQVGDLVLLWDQRKEKSGNQRKFDSLWLGSYINIGSVGPNSFHLSTLDGDPLKLPTNGQIVKLFYKDDI